MGTLIAQLAPSLFLALIVLIPMWRLLVRLGLSRLWLLLLLIPLFGIFILIWVIAFRRWPARSGTVEDVFK